MSRYYCPAGKKECAHYRGDYCYAIHPVQIVHVSGPPVEVCPWPSLYTKPGQDKQNLVACSMVFRDGEWRLRIRKDPQLNGYAIWIYRIDEGDARYYLQSGGNYVKRSAYDSTEGLSPLFVMTEDHMDQLVTQMTGTDSPACELELMDASKQIDRTTIEHCRDKINEIIRYLKCAK